MAKTMAKSGDPRASAFELSLEIVTAKSGGSVLRRQTFSYLSWAHLIQLFLFAALARSTVEILLEEFFLHYLYVTYTIYFFFRTHAILQKFIQRMFIISCSKFLF